MQVIGLLGRSGSEKSAQAGRKELQRNSELILFVQPRDRMANQLRLAVQPELVLDVLVMRRDRLGTDEEALGDLTGLIPATDQLEDFEFPL